jgi:hypothetical protein
MSLLWICVATHMTCMSLVYNEIEFVHGRHDEYSYVHVCRLLSAAQTIELSSILCFRSIYCNCRSNEVNNILQTFVYLTIQY